MLAEAVLAEQTRLSAPLPQLCASKIFRMHLWLEPRGERNSGERQCLEPSWRLPTHCHLMTSWPLRTQGQARFKLRKLETAKIETWTGRRLQNPRVFVFLLFTPQTRKGLAGVCAVDGVRGWFWTLGLTRGPRAGPCLANLSPELL